MASKALTKEAPTLLGKSVTIQGSAKEEPHGHSVVICTKDRHGLLSNALERLSGSEEYLRFVVVVDSSEATYSFTKSSHFAMSKVHYVRSKPGLPHQRNVGLAELRKLVAGTNQIVTFLDDDVVLGPEFFQNLNEVVTECSVLRPAIFGAADADIDAAKSRIKRKHSYKQNIRRTGTCLSPFPQDHGQLFSFVSGGCFSVHMEDLQDFEFDGRFSMQGEDVMTSLAFKGNKVCDPRLSYTHLRATQGKPENRTREEFELGFKQWLSIVRPDIVSPLLFIGSNFYGLGLASLRVLKHAFQPRDVAFLAARFLVTAKLLARRPLRRDWVKHHEWGKVSSSLTAGSLVPLKLKISGNESNLEQVPLWFKFINEIAESNPVSEDAIVLFVDFAWRDLFRLKGRKAKRVLLCNEPRSVRPGLHSRLLGHFFGLRIVSHPSQISSARDTWIRFNWRDNQIDSLSQAPCERQQGTIGIVASNKFSAVRGEGYSIRRKLLAKLAKSNANKLLVAGRGWDEVPTGSPKAIISRVFESLVFGLFKPSSLRNLVVDFQDGQLVGPVNDRVSFLSACEFALVVENDFSYSSEKLFDALKAGCVPLYWGPNPEVIGVPQSAVLRLDKSGNNLAKLLRSSSKELECVRDAGRRYLESIEDDIVFTSSGMASELKHTLRVQNRMSD